MTLDGEVYFYLNRFLCHLFCTQFLSQKDIHSALSLFGWTGKIAASSGHASWVSSKQSRNRVFELRARSDAVIVGGNTVRRDGTHYWST